jgi:ABC-type amino acid transport substrate-binding protein
MKSSITLVSLLVAAFLLGDAPGLFAAEIAPAGRPALRVGVSPNSPPMIFKSGKNIAGVEADCALALGRALGREVQFVEVPWPDLIDALNEGRIDIIMSSMSMTRPRLFRVAFSDPYLRVGQMALVRADEKYLIGPFAASLNKRTVGVKKGTTGDLLMQQEFPTVKRKFYTSGEDAAKALKKGKIDLFINDSTMIWYLGGIYESEGLVVSPQALTEEVLAWAVNRSDVELLASVNGFLKNARASGELDRVLHRWIPRLK